MVSANLRSVGNEFGDMVEQRDFAGFVAGAGLLALGGVLSEMLHDRIAPRINQPANPTTSQGLAVSGLMKLLIGAGMGGVSLRMDGMSQMAFAVLGLGALTTAGVDIIEAVDLMRSSGTTTATTRGQTATAPSRSGSVRSTQSSRTSRMASRSPHNASPTSGRSVGRARARTPTSAQTDGGSQSSASSTTSKSGYEAYS